MYIGVMSNLLDSASPTPMIGENPSLEEHPRHSLTAGRIKESRRVPDGRYQLFSVGSLVVWSNWDLYRAAHALGRRGARESGPVLQFPCAVALTSILGIPQLDGVRSTGRQTEGCAGRSLQDEELFLSSRVTSACRGATSGCGHLRPAGAG